MNKDELKRLMDAAGWTAPRLARALNVSVDTVRAWKSGKRRPCCVWTEREIRRVLDGEATSIDPKTVALLAAAESLTDAWTRRAHLPVQEINARMNRLNAARKVLE